MPFVSQRHIWYSKCPPFASFKPIAPFVEYALSSVYLLSRPRFMQLSQKFSSNPDHFHPLQENSLISLCDRLQSLNKCFIFFSKNHFRRFLLNFSSLQENYLLTQHRIHRMFMQPSKWYHDKALTSRIFTLQHTYADKSRYH